MTNADRVRLHISPFNPTLLDAVIPKSVQPSATSISYHSIQSEPGRAYGFVELPKAEADKVRKRLNGLTLRGAKMSIEVARPEKRRRREETETEPVDTSERKSKRTKKVKPAQGEIVGFELPEGRSVKRGWTDNTKESKSAKDSKTSDKKSKQEKSKFSNDKEVLFKAGRKEKVIIEKSPASTDPDSKKRKREGPKVVHEFENTTKTPTFLRDAKSGRSGGALSFVDGQGWVNEDGEVVDAVKTRSRPARPVTQPASSTSKPELSKEEQKKSVAVAQSGEETSSSEEEEESDESSELSESESDSESEEDDSSESEESGEEESEESVSASEDDETEVKMTQAVSAAIDEIPAAVKPLTPQHADGEIPQEGEIEKTVHPLEALYKRQPGAAPKLAPINTSFSFFDADGDEIDPEAHVDVVAENHIPQTPGTKRDLHVRGNRSAAPTPDTAAIGRKFSFAFGRGAMDEEDEDEEDEEQVQQGATDSPLTKRLDKSADDNGEGSTEQSAFVKAFYEKRADLNRSWKTRKRDALKQQRQRENRRLSKKPL